MWVLHSDRLLPSSCFRGPASLRTKTFLPRGDPNRSINIIQWSKSINPHTKLLNGQATYMILQCLGSSVEHPKWAMTSKSFVTLEKKQKNPNLYSLIAQFIQGFLVLCFFFFPYRFRQPCRLPGDLNYNFSFWQEEKMVTVNTRNHSQSRTPSQRKVQRRSLSLFSVNYWNRLIAHGCWVLPPKSQTSGTVLCFF